MTRLDEQPNRRPLKRVAYRPREVAEMVGMSESGVRNLIKRGALRAVQLDGRWLIPAAVIEDIYSVPAPPGVAASLWRAEMLMVFGLASRAGW